MFISIFLNAQPSLSVALKADAKITTLFPFLQINFEIFLKHFQNLFLILNQTFLSFDLTFSQIQNVSHYSHAFP